MLERLKLWVDLKKGQFQNKYCKTYLTIKIFLHVNDCIVFLKKSNLVYTKTVDSVFCVL